MRGFYIPPVVELLLAVGLTIAVTQHVFLYLGLLLVAGLILPSARMGDTRSFIGGTFPDQNGLFIALYPTLITVGALDHFMTGDWMMDLFSDKSLLAPSSVPFKGIALFYFVNKTFLFSFLRANYTFKESTLFDYFVLFLCISSAYFSPLFLYIDVSKSLLGSIFITVGCGLVIMMAFSGVAVVLSFLLSVGRR